MEPARKLDQPRSWGSPNISDNLTPQAQARTQLGLCLRACHWTA